MRMISQIILILCPIVYACIGMDSSEVPSLKECSIRAALATPEGRKLLLKKPRAYQQQASLEPDEPNPIPADIKEEVARVFKKDPLLHLILDAYEDHNNRFSVTAVYIYYKPAHVFLKQHGDLTSLTPAQLQAVVRGHYYHRKGIGRHRTRLSQEPQSIGALVFGNDPDLRQKFEDAYRWQSWNVKQKWNVKTEESVIHACDKPGWLAMVVIP